MSPEECEALTDVFRGSTRSPEHLAFLARPVVEALIAAHVAAALTEASDDPALRLTGHSGISIRRLRARARPPT